MNEMYTETCVKRKSLPFAGIVKPGMIIIGVIFFLMGMMNTSTGAGGILLSLIGIAIFVAMFFVVPMLDVQFEYVFCDGQIDFDRISGGEKRKTLLRIDMDNVEIMAPAKSHELDSYRNRNDVTVKDFSSKDPEAKTYGVFVTGEKGKYFIIFEPSEKMVEFARQKAPRKVTLY